MVGHAFGRRNIALAMSFILLSMLPLSSARASAEAGTVLTLRGPCILVSGGLQTDLKADDVVHVGDTVKAPAGAKFKLRMIDGSVVTAGSGTTLTIQSYSIDTTADHRDAVLSLAGGLLRAVVSKVTQPSTFEVTTATGVAAVRSTDWFIENTPASTRVGVLKGVVVLTSAATKRAMSIPAGQGSHVSVGKDPVPARVWTQAAFDDVIKRTDLN